jgi:hypothetical protein
MIHRDAAVGANQWIGFSHFNNFNEAERTSGRIAATPNPHVILGELVNPSRIMSDRGQEGLPPAETINTFETIYFPAQRKHLARDNPRDAARYRSSPRARGIPRAGKSSDSHLKAVIAPVHITLPLRRGEQKRQNPSREVVGNNCRQSQKKAGWNWGCVSALDCEWRTIWIADAHRGDGKRFIVHADEILTAFLELAIRFARSGRTTAARQRNGI